MDNTLLVTPASQLWQQKTNTELRVKLTEDHLYKQIYPK